MEKRLNGMIQLGPRRLIIERRERKEITYRIEADVHRHWGQVPKPGIVWVLQRGVTRDPIQDLKERVEFLYGIKDRRDIVIRYQGSEQNWPYV